MAVANRMHQHKLAELLAINEGKSITCLFLPRILLENILLISFVKLKY